MPVMRQQHHIGPPILLTASHFNAVSPKADEAEAGCSLALQMAAFMALWAFRLDWNPSLCAVALMANSSATSVINTHSNQSTHRLMSLLLPSRKVPWRDICNFRVHPKCHLPLSTKAFSR